MSEAIFPDIQTTLRLILAELPEGVFPYDLADSILEDKRSVSSSELRAHADLIASLYENLSSINADKALTTVTEAGISEWERQLFSNAQDSSLDFEVRKSKSISKFRSTGGISYQAINRIVAGILEPLGLEFQLAPWSGPFNGGWLLGDSELEMGTYLTSLDPIMGVRGGIPEIDCDLDFAASDLTADELRQIQEYAYTYELRIFGSASTATLATLDAILTHFEPARSKHLILNENVGNVIVPTPDAISEWSLEDSALDDDTYLTAGEFWEAYSVKKKLARLGSKTSGPF